MKDRSLFFVLLSCCIVAVSQRAMAATYYVSPSGGDLNPGTSTQSPWQSLDKVNTVDLDPGDSVLLEAGHDYPGNLLLTAGDAGTPTQPVIIGSYGSGRARIKAGDSSGVTVQNAGGIEVKDLVVMGNDYKTNVGSGIKIVNELLGNRKLEYIRMHNVEASGFGREKNVTRSSAGPNGCGIFVGGNAPDKSKSGYNDVRITNCVAYQNEYFGILITGCYRLEADTYANSEVYVGYCTMYDNPGDAEYRKNHSGSGIRIGDVDSGMIEYCEAYNNGYEGTGSVGIWATSVNNVIIQHCESHHNRTGGGADGGGFDLDGGTTNSILQYNYSHDNDGAGYMIYSYKYAPYTNKNSVVRYNISVNDGQKNNYRSIIVGTGSPEDNPIRNAQIYGNVVYGTISPVISVRRNGIYSTKICNNLFITANNQALVQRNSDKSGVVFAGNAYWAVDGQYDFGGYKSLEDWQKATGQEMLNRKPVGLVVDPKLMDMGKSITVGDPTKLHSLTAWRLQEDSPLIDAGLDIRSLFGINPGDRDFYGNPIPRGKGFDIGAHETPVEPQTSPGRERD